MSDSLDNFNKIKTPEELKEKWSALLNSTNRDCCAMLIEPMGIKIAKPKMTDPFDDLIEKTRENYRVSWEKSIKNFERFCIIQNFDFKFAMRHGKFPLQYAVEEYSLELKDDLKYIIIHPEVYKVIENYKNQTPIQRFFWNLKWGFKDCRDNFKNWQGHMKGEDWDFWEFLSSEETGYE